MGLNFKKTGQLRFTGTSYILPPYLNIQFLSEPANSPHKMKGDFGGSEASNTKFKTDYAIHM